MDDGDAEVFGERRTSRTRKIAPKVVAVLVNEGSKKKSATARLEALENDNAMQEPVDLNEDDDNFEIENEEEVLAVKKKPTRGSKRKTRQSKVKPLAAKKVVKTFVELLQEAHLEALPPHVPSYLTAAMGPPTTCAPRSFCSVCGFTSPYTCTKCGARFCSSKCQTVHSDTRCLKFVA